jgi:hypothetical protein
LEDLGAALALVDLGLGHPVANADELAVNILHASLNGVSDRFLDLLLDETGREGLQRLVQEIVLRVPDRELERVDLDDDVLHFEVERDIAHVRLHLAKGEREFVVLFVLKSIVGAEFQVVLGFRRDIVRKEVSSREREVLHDQVERIIGVLDSIYPRV